MDNQPIIPPQPLPEQQVKSNLAWLKTLSIGFSLVSFGIAIGIVGYALTINKNQPVEQNQKPAPTISQPLPTIDPTANWEMYTNTRLGYSLKYPSDWKLTEHAKDSGGDESNPQTEIISPDISSATAGGYLKYYSIIIGKQKFELPTENSSNVIINNITVTRYMVGGLEGEYVIFKQNDKAVVLNFNPYTKEQSDPKFYAIFNQILSTFKFIN